MSRTERKKKGALMRLAEGELSNTLCFMTRFFVAIGYTSELPYEEQSFGRPQGDAGTSSSLCEQLVLGDLVLY